VRCWSGRRIGLIKTELHRNPAALRTARDRNHRMDRLVYNHRRLHTEIGDIPPAEHETHWYRQQPLAHTAGTTGP
jgi:putative transposase